MNPKEFSWTEDQNVTVKNPTEKDYEFKVHNKPYMVKSGQKVRMAGYIAWVYVYGLGSQMCQKDKNFGRWNEEGYRNEYYDKIVDNADSPVQVIEEVEPPTFEEVDSQKPTRGRPAKS